MRAVLADKVSKKFILARDRPRNLADAARAVFRRRRREDFWALKEVSFEVEQGEALGIIGHNGAGKSTMLKLLTRIMQPTIGTIRTRGRVSALIEIGAGFHPEMTGRENIYLNGSILGMTHREIDRKFDEMVAFAELEQFIDTPVKRYSSGMYARLGFSVAAHVDPDILVVDEVLSVGDAAFQAKCASRMRQIKEQGVTLVFVSHNFSAVTSICSRAIGLWRGSVFTDTTPSAAIAVYREMLARDAAAPEHTARKDLSALDSDLLITQVESDSSAGEWEVHADGPWRLRIHYEARRRVQTPEFAFRITNSDGVVIYQPCTIDYEQARDVNGPGTVEFEVEQLPLLPGRYALEVFVWDACGVTAYDYGRHSYDLLVLPSIAQKSSTGPGIRLGLLKLQGRWVWPDESLVAGDVRVTGEQADEPRDNPRQ